MENKSNIAIIDIEKYNALRDFKENLLKGEYVTVKNRYSTESYYFHTRDKMVDSLTTINKNLIEENQKLVEKNSTLSGIQDKAVNEGRERLNKAFARYNIWEFLRWRKRFRANFTNWNKD